MKTIRIILILAIVALGITFTSCSKDEGFEGSAIIKGKVTYAGGTASDAVVSLKFGATSATSDYDYSTISDGSGDYRFEGLSKGDYFVDATYMDDLGNIFESGGAHVEIGGNKSEVTVDFNLE